MLGEKQDEFLGVWGLISANAIVLSRFCTTVYPAIGKPKFSVYAQLIHLIFNSFINLLCEFHSDLYLSRSFADLIIVNLFFVYYLIKLNPLDFKNIFPSFFSIIMIIFYWYFGFSNDALTYQFSTF